MSNLSRKPTQQQGTDWKAKYEQFGLMENPFPTSPVNKDSNDPRINGTIYETDIRTKEFERIETTFLQRSQTEPAHLRLGYICDTSYIGRGNGKSAFLVNLMHRINQEYCLDISGELNKCFAVIVAPESGGRTKTFDRFVDLLFSAIYSSPIIEVALAILRLDVIVAAYPGVDIDESDEKRLVVSLNSQEWFEEQGIEYRAIMEKVRQNEFLQAIPEDFPLVSSRRELWEPFLTKESFMTAYKLLKKGREKLDFVFSHLVQMFMASGFNGAYIFVDDFERVPDFQSGRQRKDFAAELRSVLLDGPYENARYGFFNMFLVLHAGVPALISDAWLSSGLDQRYPLSPKVESPHLIPFEKLTSAHVRLLLKKYLNEYRVDSFTKGDLFPFESKAIAFIAGESEYNAASILRTCNSMIEMALAENRHSIDEDFVRNEFEKREGVISEEEPSLDDSSAIDLRRKATDS